MISSPAVLLFWGLVRAKKNWLSFAVAARYPLVKGFAVGRTIFSAAAWMAGELTDEQAIADMAENYQRLCNMWDNARALQSG